MADLTRAVAINPKFVAAYNNLGTIKLQTGDYDGAIADYTKAIELQPKLTVGYVGRGLAYGQKGLSQQAQEDFDKARAIDPTVQIPSVCVVTSAGDIVNSNADCNHLFQFRKHECPQREFQRGYSRL